MVEKKRASLKLLLLSLALETHKGNKESAEWEERSVERNRFGSGSTTGSNQTRDSSNHPDSSDSSASVPPFLYTHTHTHIQTIEEYTSDSLDCNPRPSDNQYHFRAEIEKRIGFEEVTLSMLCLIELVATPVLLA